jgi:hypothetical protein
MHRLPVLAHPQTIEPRCCRGTVGQLMRTDVVGVGMRNESMRLPSAHVEREPRSCQE